MSAHTVARIPLRVLIVDARPADAQLLAHELRRAGFDPEWQRVDTESGFLAALRPAPDVILSDFHLPAFDPFRALALLQERGWDIPFIIVSGEIGEETAIAALHEGVADYLIKDRLARLGPAITRAIGQKRLRAEKREATDALENAVEGIAHLDTTFRYISVNCAYAKMLGCAPEEMVGADWARTVHPGDRAAVEAAYGRMLEAGKGRCEVRGVRRDGSEFWKEVLMVKARDREGRSAGHYSFVRDITARKEAEEQLRSQARLLDLAHDAILVRDMAHRVQYWNEGAERLYGWTAAEAMGRDVRELIRPAPEKFAEAMRALLEKGEWTDEQKHAHRSDRSIAVLSRGTLVRDEAGEPKCVLVINTDITERKKFESQFLRAQRMESIGTLASGVAHDLNNILAPILMSATLLRRELAVHMRESLISTIVTCVERGAGIVRQVLTFARGTTGERAVLQPRHLLREVQKIITETFPKNIAIQDRVASELWTVLGDATQIHQVLLNLCVNARDAMPGGGKLVLSAENFDLDENYASTLHGARPGRCVLIKVSDSGTGIPAGVIDHIFDPFFTTKEHGNGTGLGLSTVAGIVKSHGGFIGVYSEVGRGTTFRVFLPAADAAPVCEVAAPNAPAPCGHGELVLVVDDEESIRNVTGTVLARHGYDVILAADGAEALAAFVKETERIKAVITDLMMPFIDGVALIRALHSLKPGVKIIATTGHASEARLGELQAQHSGPCLVKPFNSALLLTTLHDLIHQPLGK